MKKKTLCRRAQKSRFLFHVGLEREISCATFYGPGDSFTPPVAVLQMQRGNQFNVHSLCSQCATQELKDKFKS